MGDLLHHNSSIIIPRLEEDADTEVVIAMRTALDAIIARKLERFDLIDGDPDREQTDAEDDFTPHPSRRWYGPGCEIADPAEDDDPAGQYDEDDYTGPRPKGYGPGCKISDDDFEHDGRELGDGY